MKFSTKYKLMLWKSYFETGYGFTSYLKYLIGFFALASKDVELTLIFGIIYGILCFILGWILFKYGWYEAQAEVGNRYNKFQREVRKKIRKI